MQLVQVFFSPAAAFASLREKKWAWVLPTLLLMVIGVATIAVMLGRFPVIEIMEQSAIENGQEMPPGAAEQAAAFMNVFFYVIPLFTIPVMLLVVALLLFGIVKATAGETSFPAMLNATAYSVWPWSLASSLLMMVMLLTAPDVASASIQNPVPLNLGYFFDKREIGGGLYALLSGLDVMSFYFIALLSIGAAQLAKRVSFGKVFWPLLGLYLLWTLGKAGVAALTS